MVIVNPYLKKKPLTGSAPSSRGATSSSAQPAPTARRQQPGPTPTGGGSIRRPPNANASSSSKISTAPPKRPAQQQQHRQNYVSGKSAGVVSANGRAAVGINTAGHHTRPANAAASAKASAATNGIKAIGPSALTNRPSVTTTSTTSTSTMARQPTTLKAQLKQQIADLKRAKLLRQQERQAAERKRQLDEKRRRDEAVQAQVRAREEAERKRREEAERRQRAKLERQRAEEEEKKKRQVLVREEVTQVLSSLVSLVEMEGSPDHQQQQQVEKEEVEMEVETKEESKEQMDRSNESISSVPSSAGPSSSMPSPHASRSPTMHPPFHNQYPPDAYQHYHQYGPHGPVATTTTMGPPPPPSHHPHAHSPYKHHQQPPMPVPVPVPAMMMVMPPSQQQHPPYHPHAPVGQDGVLPHHHSKTPSAGAASSSSSHRPSKKVTPSPYGMMASAYSSTPTASSPVNNRKKQGHQYQQQQYHYNHHQYQQHSFADAESTSPNKALSFASPTKAAPRGRGGGTLLAATSPNRKWESPVDHGAIIENIFKEMGEFETGKAGNGFDGSPSSHGSFHIDISPIKIEGLADSPPRDEAGAASSSRPDMPQLTGKGRGTGGSGKDNGDVAEMDRRRQEQAPPPQPPYRQPLGTWMSPHSGATPTRGAPPPPPASAYFVAYSQQFPFGFPPHAYPFPFPNKMTSPTQGSGEAVPATPSSSSGNHPQQGMMMPMPSPFGAWPTATATPGRPASAATKPATPSSSVATRTPASKTSGANPESANKSKGSVAKGASPRPSPNKKAGTTILHERIMEPPSPFANSYEIVKNPIVITKDIGGSFGIDMKQDTRSVLVDSYALSKAGEKKDQKPASPKKKRRRVYFSAMLTVKAEKQNSRKDAAKKGSDILRPGDIILTVDGRPTGGLLFKQAAALFAVAKTPAKGNESTAIQCVLTVARPKIMAPGAKPSFVAVPQQKVPLVLGQNGLIISGDFNDTEIKAVLDGYKTVRKYGDLLLPTANYGAAALGFLRSLLTHPTIGRDLARRDMNAIITKLSFTKAKMVLAMNAAAIKHFSAQWQKECERASKDNIGSHADGELKLMTDAKRSTLRLLPRPGKGCKCGAEDHRFAHDERCLLYRDIIPHVKAQDLEPFKRSSKKMRSRKAEAEIDSAIVSALQERQVQAKRDQEDERQEAMFVDLMERTQVTKLKKAIFAPGQLSVAIISAVATLADQRSPSRVEEGKDSDDDSDDDDDDIPLNALSSSTQHPSKKQKIEATSTTHHPSFTSIAEILLHVSKTWGHLLKEFDTNAEYAWHLKLGGLDSGESLDQYRRNPRPAESLSFENIQFLLNNTIMSRLRSPPPQPSPPAAAGKTTGVVIGASATPTQSSSTSTPTASAAPSSKSSAKPQPVAEVPVPTAAYVRMMDELTVAILASQECTGLWDEIQSLLTSEVLQVDRDGTVILRKDWQDNVGASILLDGNEKGWFRDQDPSNSFCLHEDVRSLVPDIWVRRDNGWAFADSKPGDGVEFSENEYLDIKREYIRDYGTHFDQVDGVGRFGDKRYGM